MSASLFSGIFTLLDDLAMLAKVSASSLDDALSQAARAGAKAAGVVVDDAAVTPRYVVGFAASRELPIVWAITKGSIKNKLLFLLPAALVLSAWAPWLITPLLMMGGLYLSFEGAEKVVEKLLHKPDPTAEISLAKLPDPIALERKTVKGAIRTDLILSAEIMAITLATVAEQTSSVVMQAILLAVVGVGITCLVYGAVALIVKADDFGLWLAQSQRRTLRNFGRALVHGMPKFLVGLALTGTAAMLWVGGAILIHGLASFGLTGVEHTIQVMTTMAATAVPGLLAGITGWLVGALGASVVGLVAGGVALAVVDSALYLRGLVQGETQAPAEEETDA